MTIEIVGIARSRRDTNAIRRYTIRDTIVARAIYERGGRGASVHAARMRATLRAGTLGYAVFLPAVKTIMQYLTIHTKRKRGRGREREREIERQRGESCGTMAVAVSGREGIGGREIRKVGVNVGRADVGFHFPSPLQNADLREHVSLSFSVVFSVAHVLCCFSRAPLVALLLPRAFLSSALLRIHPSRFFSPPIYPPVSLVCLFSSSHGLLFPPRASLSSACCKLLGGILALHPRRCFYVTPPVTQRVRASNGQRKDVGIGTNGRARSRGICDVYTCVYDSMYAYTCVYISVWRIQGRVRGGGRAGGGARLFSSEYVGQQRLG